MYTYDDYRLKSMYGPYSHGSADLLMVYSPVRSIGQSVTEGERKREKTEERKVYECVIDRDGGNCVGERRWSGAISLTSHLTAQCFNGQHLVRGQK